MRIAFVVTGGVDRSGRDRVIPALLTLIERQARRHNFHVYALRYDARPCTYSLLGASVHDLGRPRGLVRQYDALVRALRRDGPFDLVHGYWALPAGLTAAAAGVRLGISSIVTLDSGELVSIPKIRYGLQRTWKHRLAVAATLRLATRLTVCSHFMHRLARLHGVDPELIPIGVDTSRFLPGHRADAPPWRLLHAASLNAVKDQTTLLQALRRVVDRSPQVHLDIAGEDTLGGQIHELATRLRLGRHVTFHGALSTESWRALHRDLDPLLPARAPAGRLLSARSRWRGHS